MQAERVAWGHVPEAFGNMQAGIVLSGKAKTNAGCIPDMYKEALNRGSALSSLLCARETSSIALW